MSWYAMAIAGIAAHCCALIFLLDVAAAMATAPERPSGTRAATVTILHTSAPVNTFEPASTLGAALDGQDNGAVDRIYTPQSIVAMKRAGLGAIAYRLRTELAIEAWHWDPRGAWSDTEHQRGYWVSDDRPGEPIRECYGYRLPRRGNTIDQANNDGYSRLTDGDPGSFWKSNPYLDKRYTHEDNARHPQWIVVDLRSRKPVNAVKIDWGEPYAVRYDVQRWVGPEDPYTDEMPAGQWRKFPGAAITHGCGGTTALRLCETPVRARYLRILLLEGSGTAQADSTDVRDALGFAIREVGFGTVDAGRTFHDLVRHAPNRRQTLTYASSTDPWHRAEDLDPNIEQPGLDLVYGSGLTHGLPMMVPVGALYDTSENAAAMVRYLRARGYPTDRVEIGEEPDEQYVNAEDYGAFYLQFAGAVHLVDPKIVCGGPSFEAIDAQVRMWPREAGERPWVTRFVAYLRSHGRLRDLGFASFEWYPFDDPAKPSGPQLASVPHLLRTGLRRLRDEGIPKNVPLVMTEYGWSAFACRQEVDIEGALFNAESVGTFLELGGAATYLYGFEPSELIREGGTWGNNALLLADREGHIRAQTATYHAARMLTQDWLDSGGAHLLYRANTTDASVSAYPVRRPDGSWSVLLVNKDPDREIAVRIRFNDGQTGDTRAWRGPAEVFQFSRTQYAWKEDGRNGRPLRSDPPAHSTIPSGPVVVRLPAYSITVVRGRR